MPEAKKKCPECDVELEGDPEECAKCKLPLKDFGMFFRLFKTAAKQLTAEEDALAAAELAKKPKKLSVMDSILGKKAASK